jgi:colicin import membrane protein
MAEETDGVGETFDDSLRIALTVASQFGERIARLREQLARNREAGAVQEARELSARFEAERGAVRADLAPVQQPEWWDQARPEAIAQMHETATAWRDFDDVAKGAGDTIRREVQERFGVDVDAPGADDTAVILAIAEAERDRADAAAERAKAGEELTASQLLFAQADRREREQSHVTVTGDGTYGYTTTLDDAVVSELDGYDLTPDPNGVDESGYDPFAVPADAERAGDAAREKGSQLYDSSERRREFANELEAKGIPERTIKARVLADGENAKHPREAVTSSTGKVTKIRGKGASAVQQRARGGLSR